MKRGLVVALLLCLPLPALCQTIRCSDRIISEGSSRFEIQALCGDPQQVEQKTIFNNVATGVPNAAGIVAGTSVEVHVELWTYNFGPNKLMQRIRFEDGVVVRIESLGR